MGAWPADGSAKYASTSWKWSAAELQPISWAAWKDSDEGKSFLGQKSGRVPAYLLCLGGEIVRCAIIYQLTDTGQWFGRKVRDLEGTWFESWWQGNLGKRCVDRPLWVGAKSEDICVPSECERVTSAEEDFNISGKDDLFCGYQSTCSPRHPCLSPAGSWTKWPWWQGERDAWPQWHGRPLAKADLASTWTSNLPAAEASTESPVWHHSVGRSASCLVAGWLHWTTSITEGVVFHPYWARHLLWTWMCLLCNASAKITIHWLTECLSTVLIFHTSLLLIMEFTSQQIKYGNGPCSLTSWSIWVESCLWKTQLQQQLGGRACRAGTRLSGRLYMLRISIQYMMLSLP